MRLRRPPDEPEKKQQPIDTVAEKNPNAPALDWITRYAVPLVGVIGAALYGILRLAYLFFYLPLRATPDEVGYGYSQVLADELIGAIELVVLVALCIMPLAIAMSAAVRLLRRIRKKNRHPDSRPKIPGRVARIQKIILWCFCIAIPIVFVSLPVLAWLEGQQARDGFTVRNVYISHFIALPVLAVEAVPATITWISDSVPQAAATGARQCLLYLGDSNDDSVFYDVQSQESLVIPSAEIVIILQDTVSVPVGC
jgi:hypothetical protein